MDKGNTQIIRGVLALIILYCHIGYADVRLDNVFMSFSDLGYLAVGGFYFFMGYVLFSNYIDKGGFKKGFLLYRILRVWVPFYIANYLFYVFEIIDKAEDLIRYDSRRELLPYFFGFRLFNPTLWYPVSAMIFYIIAFVVLSLLKQCQMQNNRNALLIMSCIIMVIYAWTYSVIGLTYGENEILPCSLLLGMVFAIYKDPISIIIEKNQTMWVIFFLAFFFICHRMNMVSDTEVWGISLYKYLAPPFFVCMISTLIMGEKMQSEILGFLGEISYEIYLLHYLVLCLFRSDIVYIGNEYLYLFAYTCITVFLAWAYHRVIQSGIWPHNT